MPFKSLSQMRWMFARHPEMAKRWAAHTPDVKKLPEKAPDGPSVATEKSATRGIPMALEEDIIDACEVAGAALNRAEQVVAEKRATDAKVASLIPATIDALERAGLIDPTEKAAAARVFTDPAKVLQTLLGTAQRFGDEPRAKAASHALGRPGTGNPSVGARTDAQKESDRVWEANFGGGGT